MGLFKKGQTPLSLKKQKFSLSDDCYMWLRELSSKEFLQCQAMVAENKPTNTDFIYEIIVFAACDDEGNKLFDNCEDAKTNLDVGLSKLIEMQNVIMKMSGLDAPVKN